MPGVRVSWPYVLLLLAVALLNGVRGDGKHYKENEKVLQG